MGKFYTAVLIALSVSNLSLGAIYEKDNRKDIHELDEKVQSLSSAIAVNVPFFFFEEEDENPSLVRHSESEERTYFEELGLCPSERFAQQRSFGHCSSFLIGPKLLLTAGHCLIPQGIIENSPHPYCESFSFWFGYNTLSNASLGRNIDPKNIVHCKRVIYAENTPKDDGTSIDFALLELKEEVTHIKPLKIARRFSGSSSVFTIGHPHGLPAKHSGSSKIVSNSRLSFRVNLDTLSGNSGGPVFNRRNEVVGILVAGHQFDTTDSHGRCGTLNVCDKTGENCLVNSELDTSNHVMKNRAWLRHYLRSIDSSNLRLSQNSQFLGL